MRRARATYDTLRIVHNGDRDLVMTVFTATGAMTGELEISAISNLAKRTKVSVTLDVFRV